jgi:hypothetical protein
MSRATIERFYAAFANLDGATMQSCYADNARFEDEAFQLSGARSIGAMWRMLCENARMNGIANWKLEVSGIDSDGKRGRAHWEAHYVFGEGRRRVHNRIDAEFQFDDAGRIVRHRDRFSFWNWARQALGVPGLLLGWSGWLRAKVRQRAARQLQRWLEKNR